MEFTIVSKEWLENKGIVIQPEWRHNLDDTEYVLHKEHIEPLLNEGEVIKFYRYDNSEFRDIINGDKWVAHTEII